ncbi:hypothetical protein BDZ45DRAFT_428105 [Acephala macrosclerotiorum]|nr:hypothetical protein BDZ45DRAFT_428105 [Acephala macrosclerotiorum]
MFCFMHLHRILNLLLQLLTPFSAQLKLQAQDKCFCFEPCTPKTRMLYVQEALARSSIYNFAFGVSSARDSAYMLSISALNFFAVWGRLSFNLQNTH